MEEALSEDQRQEIETLVIEANSKLAEVGAESAEQSFGLGCLIGGLLIGGVILVLYISGLLNFIMAFIMLLMAFIALTGIATLSASFARTRRVGETYRLFVGPDLERYLRRTRLSRATFYQTADEILGEDAPLRPHLANFRSD